MKLALSQDPAALPQVVEALGLNADEGDFLAGCLRGQGLLINDLGSSFPVDIVSTGPEAALVTDDAWRQDGMNLPAPEADLRREPVELADPDLLYERLQRDREADEIPAS